MRAVLQLVNGASVRVDGQVIGQCGRGYLILLGIGQKDTFVQAQQLAQKILKLRVFPDEPRKPSGFFASGKTNGCCTAV